MDPFQNGYPGKGGACKAFQRNGLFSVRSIGCNLASVNDHSFARDFNDFLWSGMQPLQISPDSLGVLFDCG